jgi:nitrogen fixation protein
MAVNINIPSQVSQTITDGVTDKAPSENAVNDALALKANTADLGATAFSNDYNDLDNLPTIPSLTGYVPYTGATSDLDMGTHNITADHISLNVSPSGAGFGVGATQWNNTIGSSETLLKGGSVTLKNGVDLVARVVNKVSPNTTLTKAAYQAVKVSGAQGGRLAIGLAQGNTDLNSADTIGLVTETIATNQEGFIITVGQLSDINTTGSLQGETWADGDVLYLSPTTAGRLTNIKPTGATGHIVVIGYVEYAHATQGAIYVKIMNGWELDELHNVYINPSTLADNNLLQYDSSTSLWKNESLSTAGVQPTLQSGTNIKTINGTSLLGSGDITVGGGITVGTTAVTSGTIGRVFFQGTGNVVQQSASLFWDNTNSRLGVGATPSTAARLDVRAQGALSTDIAFRVRNSADTFNLLSIDGVGLISGRTDGAGGFSMNYQGTVNTTVQLGFQNTNPYLRVANSNASGNAFNVYTSSDNREYLAGLIGKATLAIGANPFGGTIKPNEANTNTLYIMNGTAPTLSATDSFNLYSADIVAGNAAPHFRTENGNIIKLYRETTAVTGSTLVSNLGIPLTDTDTFDGYTLKQIVKALRNQGLLS